MPASKSQSTVRHASTAHIPKAAQAPKANPLVIAVRSVCQRLGTGLATAAPLIALSTMPSIAHADAVIHVTPGAAGVNNGDGCSLVLAIFSNTPSSPNQIGLSGSSARPPIPVPTLGPLALLLMMLSTLALGIRQTRV